MNRLRAAGVPAFFVLAIGAYAACGGGSSSNDGSAPADGGVTDGTLPDSAALDSGPSEAADAGTDATDAGDDDAAFQPQTFTLALGPISLGTGTEDTKCVTQRLGNVGPVHIGSLHTTLTGGSADLVVYAVADTVESLTPTDCQPLQAIATADAGTALTITQRADEVLQLPAHDGFTFADHQMIRLELQGTDTGSGIGTTVSFTTMPDSAYQREVGMVLAGTPDIDLPPETTTTTTETLFPSALQTKDLLVLTGHEHSLGTDLTLGYADDGGADAALYESTSWSDPPIVVLAPPQTLAATGGIRLSCTWTNPSSSAVKFGVSAADEQCFFRAHYAPSDGSRVCVHTDQVGGGTDVCCPGPSSLCSTLF